MKICGYRGCGNEVYGFLPSYCDSCLAKIKAEEKEDKRRENDKEDAERRHQELLEQQERQHEESMEIEREKLAVLETEESEPTYYTSSSLSSASYSSIATSSNSCWSLIALGLMLVIFAFIISFYNEIRKANEKIIVSDSTIPIMIVKPRRIFIVNKCGGLTLKPFYKIGDGDFVEWNEIGYKRYLEKTLITKKKIVLKIKNVEEGTMFKDVKVGEQDQVAFVCETIRGKRKLYPRDPTQVLQLAKVFAKPRRMFFVNKCDGVTLKPHYKIGNSEYAEWGSVPVKRYLEKTLVTKEQLTLKVEIIEERKVFKDIKVNEQTQIAFVCEVVNGKKKLFPMEPANVPQIAHALLNKQETKESAVKTITLAEIQMREAKKQAGRQ